MSDPRDNEDMEKVLLELSSDDPMDEETEDDEDIPPIIIDDSPPESKGRPHSPAEAGFIASSGLIEVPVGDHASEPIPPVDETLGSPQVPAPASVVHHTENDFGPGGAPNTEAEKEIKLGVAELENDGIVLSATEAEKEIKPGVVELENDGIVLSAEAKAVRAEDKLLPEVAVKQEEGSNQLRPASPNFLLEGDNKSVPEEEQFAFMKELERFHKERSLEFKPPKFYGEGLNLLKLWRAVAGLGGYERVTTCKLWRQVGESFKPPKTCTTVSWTFRIFYEKALLEYEKHKILSGELQVPIPSLPENMPDKKTSGNQTSGSGRARRDAAARAMQGWHAQRYLGNGEVGEPIIKEKNPALKRDKHLKSIGSPKRKKSSSLERAAKVARSKPVKTQGDSMVIDIGEPADWVKINVRQIKDCFEVYALVPGLLREEVHIQSDPCGRLIISGKPEQSDNPWGVTAFKKVVTLPLRIDAHQTSAVVTLHGQLFVRVPFEQSDVER